MALGFLRRWWDRFTKVGRFRLERYETRAKPQRWDENFPTFHHTFDDAVKAAVLEALRSHYQQWRVKEHTQGVLVELFVTKGKNLPAPTVHPSQFDPKPLPRETINVPATGTKLPVPIEPEPVKVEPVVEQPKPIILAKQACSVYVEHESEKPVALPPGFRVFR
jgi:hypothetical protein